MSYRRHLMASREKMRDYLCFTALEEGTFTLSIPAILQYEKLQFVEYSINEGKKWIKTNNVDNTAVTITTPTIPEGGKVYWRGEGSTYNQNSTKNDTTNYAARFSSTCRFDISGLLASLIARKKVSESSTLYNGAFAGLFSGCTTLVNAKDLIVPKNVAYRCYFCMFNNCTSLISAPVLPATVLATRCYESLFGYCTNANFKCIKMLATNIGGEKDYCLRSWVYPVTESTTSIFVKHINATWDVRGQHGVPTKWKIIYYDPELDKYYLDQNRDTECDERGVFVRYDAEVEYLESDGTAYIDTGIRGSSNLYTELVFQTLSVTGGNGIFGQYQADRHYYIYTSNSNPVKWQIGFGTYDNTVNADTAKHTLELGNNKAILDGTQVASYNTTFDNTKYSIALCKMRATNGSFYNAPPTRIYSCKMINNGVLVRDYIPVRVGQVGYLYDKVTRTYFTNANSSGAFTIGPDINI